jgi:hypothetical protein
MVMLAIHFNQVSTTLAIEYEEDKSNEKML